MARYAANPLEYRDKYLIPAITHTSDMWILKRIKFVDLPSYREIEDYDEELSVSIICVNWWSTPCLPFVFKSFADQDFRRDKMEVLFVDDNSPDKELCERVMLKIMRKYRDLKIRFFETHKNITWNCCLSTNIAAKRAEGDILVFSESDLILVSKDYLKAVVKHHSRLKNLFLSPLNYERKEDNKLVYWLRQNGDAFLNKVDLDNPDPKILTIRCVPTTMNGASMPRERFIDVHGLDERFRGWGGMEDDLYVRLARAGVIHGQDIKMRTLHLYYPPGRQRYEKFLHPKPKPDVPIENIIANPDSWGEIDTLEEIYPS